MTHVSNNSGNNEWYTPPCYIESARAVMGGIDHDPASNDIAQRVVRAATYNTIENSGLDSIWSGRVWMNPPYSSKLIGAFCQRLAMFHLLGTISESVVMTNNATDTRWFESLMSHAAAVCLVRGRIRFLSPSGELGNAPLQGQVFTYTGQHVGEFASEFSKYGKVVRT